MTAPKIGKTIADSTPWWPQAQTPPKGAPNLLVVLFDDVGFSDFGCYGSPIETPTIDALAAGGLRYTSFHTTAMCSTTRAALLTGRNHHSVGMGCLANFDSGYPGYRGKITKEAATLAEMLRPAGYRNYMLGKWHVTSLTETGPTGPFDGWPLGRGFDRFYGFMDAETDQYAPELVRDNTPIEQPKSFAEGYHLTEDLTDQAIRFIADHQSSSPDTPWLTWIGFGACHAPHQAPQELILKYDAIFAFKFSPRPNTPAIHLADSIPDEVKMERLRILNDRQREIQRTHYARHLHQLVEVMVEGYNHPRGQVIGRSSQNKTVNFTTAQPILPAMGSYMQVRITQTLPNCLVGEAAAAQ